VTTDAGNERAPARVWPEDGVDQRELGVGNEDPADPIQPDDIAAKLTVGVVAVHADAVADDDLMADD